MKMDEKRIYEAYEEVRRSGVTNMFDIRTVSQLSGLSKEEIIYVMENYTELRNKYEKGE